MMRIARTLLLTLFAIGLLAACGSPADEAPEVTEAPVAEVPVEAPAEASAESIDTSGELKMMTAEDMEKLREERKEAIERDSPLGEENDPVEELQRQQDGH